MHMYNKYLYPSKTSFSPFFSLECLFFGRPAGLAQVPLRIGLYDSSRAIFFGAGLAPWTRSAGAAAKFVRTRRQAFFCGHYAVPKTIYNRAISM